MPSVRCHMSFVICHMSCVMCHMSSVPCNFFSFLFYGPSGEASQWSFCYQHGVPSLVFSHLNNTESSGYFVTPLESSKTFGLHLVFLKKICVAGFFLQGSQGYLP